jgi:TPR repeat protein
MTWRLILSTELQQATSRGFNVPGQNNFGFGFCLRNGFGVEKDLVRAAEYYRLSE